MKKVLIPPIHCESHAILCQELQAMAMDALQVAGFNVTELKGEADFKDAGYLLMLGVGEWGIGQHGDILSTAGKRGIRRIFWQLETLPPHDLPSARLVNFLLQPGPDRTKGLRRLFERLGYQYLAREIATLPWNRDGVFDPRRFALPFREARKLIMLWKNNLIDEILVSQESRQKFLASRGIPSRFMPFGYHPILGSPRAGVARDLDVVFLGTLYQKRSILLDQIGRSLSEHGYQLTIVDRACYGEDRARLLNRAKILLFLRNYPWEMPRMRMLMAMGCKAMIVTESFTDTTPFRPGEHFAMSPSQELSNTLLRYLENDQARQEICERTYAFVSQSLRLGGLLDGILRPDSVPPHS